MAKWNLIIDVAECHNCHNCVVAAKDELVGHEFPSYTAPHPVQGLGVIIVSPRKDLAKYENYLASVGGPSRVWPEDPPRDVYHVVLHLEPLDAARRSALGYDVSTDPVRRAALDRARDGGPRR